MNGFSFFSSTVKFLIVSTFFGAAFASRYHNVPLPNTNLTTEKRAHTTTGKKARRFRGTFPEIVHEAQLVYLCSFIPCCCPSAETSSQSNTMCSPTLHYMMCAPFGIDARWQLYETLFICLWKHGVRPPPVCYRT